MSQAKFNGKVTGPRYVKKFTNGVHNVFDRETFGVVAVFRTQKEMDEDYKKNAPAPKRAS